VLAKVAAEAVRVTVPEVPLDEIVVAVAFMDRYGPSRKSIVSSVQST
jgi:hypothetical protein